jgi:hypothetical protein
MAVYIAMKKIFESTSNLYVCKVKFAKKHFYKSPHKCAKYDKK